jgi:two-component system, sporulation sensor kinase E
VAHFTLLSHLAAGVSHELRNPLGVIVLHVDLLEEELRQPSPESATEITQALTEIKVHLARVADHVQNHLSILRVNALQPVPLDLGMLVMQCAQEMPPALAAHGITLRLDALEQLGIVALHASTFRRALVNLVHNAIDAMPQGGTLTLQGRRQAATVHSPCGIPAMVFPQSTPRRFLNRCIP